VTTISTCWPPGAGRDALFINDGHGRFFDDAWKRLPFERSTGRAIGTGDLDLDGRLDLIIATSDAPNRLFLAANDAFIDRTPALGLETDAATSVLLVDVDRDGDRDVITADPAGRLRLRLLVEPARELP